MKKYLGLLVVMVFGFAFLTGCGSTKTLTCTRSEDEEGMEMNTTMNVTFDNDVISGANAIMEFKVPEEYLKVLPIEKFAEEIEKEFIGSIPEGVTTDTKSKGDTITITMDIDVDKLDNKSKEEMDLDGSSYEEVKKSLEEEGYSCK